MLVQYQSTCNGVVHGVMQSLGLCTCCLDGRPLWVAAWRRFFLARQLGTQVGALALDWEPCRMLGILYLCWMSAALRLMLDKEPAVDLLEGCWCDMAVSR